MPRKKLGKRLAARLAAAAQAQTVQEEVERLFRENCGKRQVTRAARNIEFYRNSDNQGNSRRD